MQAADWEASAVLLTGLSLNMDPSKARLALEAGFVETFSDGMITSLLRVMGSRVFFHERLMPFYQNKPSGPHILAFFMSASYRTPESPRPNGPSDPRLRDSRPLPLEEWDNLYYALVAEVRKFYQDLQFHYGEKFEEGKTVLHDHGPDAIVSGMSKWNVKSMAGLLEEYWRYLMDYRLVAKLDEAVMLQQAQMEEKVHHGDDSTVGHASAAVPAPPQGLIDVNKHTPEELVELVWAKHEAERQAKRRSDSSSIDESTFIALARAEIRGAAGSRSKGDRSMTCECPTSCSCRVSCNILKRACICKTSQSEITDLVHEQYAIDTTARTRTHQGKGKGKAREAEHHLFGAVTNDFAQMQITAAATHDPHVIEACRTNNSKATRHDAEAIERRRRELADREGNFLAYIPPYNATPSRNGGNSKEIFPLDFYGDRSGQRYPPFRSDLSRVVPPFYGAAVPNRKPGPPQSAKSQPSSNTLKDTKETVPNSPTNNPYAKQPSLSHLQNFNNEESYAQHGKSSQDHSKSGKMRACPSLDTSVKANEYQKLAAEAESQYRPFDHSPQGFDFSFENNTSSNQAIDYSGSSDYTVSPTSTAVESANRQQVCSFHHPNLRRAPAEYTLKLHEQVKEALSEGEPLYSPPKSFFAGRAKKPVVAPKTDLPDFIAPIPASEQRWFSAGGNEPLSARKEISVPFELQAKEAAARGKRMQKDEFMRIVSDPEFMRANFCEPLVERNPAKERVSATSKHTSTPRKSGQSSSGGSAVQRRSNDSEQDNTDGHGENRERTTSGASLGSHRFEKLRRVITGGSKKVSVSDTR